MPGSAIIIKKLELLRLSNKADSQKNEITKAKAILGGRELPAKIHICFCHLPDDSSLKYQSQLLHQK